MIIFSIRGTFQRNFSNLATLVHSRDGWSVMFGDMLTPWSACDGQEEEETTWRGGGGRKHVNATTVKLRLTC